MFEYFDDNYTWNMAVNLALGMGGSIGDIDDASRALRPLAKDRDDAAAEKFFENWTALGTKLKRQAEADDARGRRLSAGAKYRRAFIAFIQAERMQRPDFALRQEAYREALDCFSRFLTLTRQNCRRVDVPYLNTSLPALLIIPQNAGGDTPCMVHFDGLDVTKEIIYLVGVPGALAERGIATLVVDNPGVGESLRMRGLHNGPEAEIPAKAAIDFLQSTPGIDRNRIGIMALSLGGYHAPRIAAFEPRVKCAVAWGANYDWGETQRRRYEFERSTPAGAALLGPCRLGVRQILGRRRGRGLGETFAQGHPASDQMPDSVHPRRERSSDRSEPGGAAYRRVHLKSQGRVARTEARRRRRRALRRRQRGPDARIHLRLDRRSFGRQSGRQ